MATHKYLFGGDEDWKASDWTSSDDRVRGGKSQSYLDIDSSCSVARFHGNLDIKTLGGAGFASQRTTGEDRIWNLSDYEGLELSIEKADSKKYTLTLKDELLPPKDGRDQSTVSYDYDFTIESEPSTAKSAKISIPWAMFKPTYRGSPKPDAPKLNLESIKRISIMFRSFFGNQAGEFSMSIKSIAAIKIAQEGKPDAKTLTAAPLVGDSDSEGIDEKSLLVIAMNEDPEAELMSAPQLHARPLRMAFARSLFYTTVVLLAVYTTMTLHMTCH